MIHGRWLILVNQMFSFSYQSICHNIIKFRHQAFWSCPNIIDAEAGFSVLRSSLYAMHRQTQKGQGRISGYLKTPSKCFICGAPAAEQLSPTHHMGFPQPDARRRSRPAAWVLHGDSWYFMCSLNFSGIQIVCPWGLHWIFCASYLNFMEFHCMSRVCSCYAIALLEN